MPIDFIPVGKMIAVQYWDRSVSIHLQSEHPGNDERLVDLAVAALEMLGGVTGPAASSLEDAEPELGRPLSKGEQPHAQACVLYILRVGIIEGLGEAGQASRYYPVIYDLQSVRILSSLQDLQRLTRCWSC